MSKPIPAIVALVSSCILFMPSIVQAQGPLQESLKEKATAKSKTPWKTEQLSPEAMMTAPTSTTPLIPIQSGRSILGLKDAIKKENLKEGWSGYLISANSIKEFKSESDRSEFLSKYDRQTALSLSSREKGYLLYANNKWYKLDKHGNELAVKTIQGSIKSKGFYVLVIGKLEDNTIIVDNFAKIIGSPSSIN